MASGVTYCALERLTHIPERSGEQGDRIAGQFFYDIYFTGGTISGVTIDDITTYISPREVTTPGTITQSLTDSAIIVENNASLAVTVNLLKASTRKTSLYVKDGKGNAGTHNITIVANGADTIDGQATAILTYNYQWILLTPIASGWTVLG